jgi:hypothetical protein
MKKRLCLLAALALAACGPPGRPQGLPPPEYEVPAVAPWSPASAAPAAAEPAPVVPEGSGAGVEPAPEAPAGLPQNAGGSGATLPAGTP